MPTTDSLFLENIQEYVEDCNIIVRGKIIYLHINNGQIPILVKYFEEWQWLKSVVFTNIYRVMFLGNLQMA